MKIDSKVDLIREIWNTHIYDSDFLMKKFDSEGLLRINYFGDVINYLDDTLKILANESFIENKPGLRDDISLLQIIYIQQDLIEELLYIFKTGEQQHKIHHDPNYKRNREIRNELIGHPLRRSKTDGSLVSTTLYHFRYSNLDNLCYLKSSIDANYKTEVISESRKEIVSRHESFLNTNLDVILQKLRNELYEYHKQLNMVLDRSSKDGFERVLQLCQSYFNKAIDNRSRYNLESLRMLNQKTAIHPRYLNTIESFLTALKAQIEEELEFIAKFCLPLFPNLRIYIENHKDYIPKDQKSFYEQNRYEINKLSEIRDDMHFRFHSSGLAKKLLDNELVELEHMGANLENEPEYASAYDYLRKLISNR